MRMIPIAAAALLAVASGMASAQTTLPRPPGANPPGATTTPVQRPAAPNPLKQQNVSQIEGNTVYGGDNRKVGHVSTVLMNPDSKRIERLVVTAGGVLGIGGHRVAIPVEKFAWDADKGAFRLPMTMVNLKAMPEWAEAEQSMTGSSTPPRNEAPPADAGR